jgi:hypothetical protein
MAQEVEHLPSKLKSLSSNFCTTPNQEIFKIHNNVIQKRDKFGCLIAASPWLCCVF